MTEPIFQSFPKITRYNNVGVTITEKIDGTNACIAFDHDGNMFCQSRKRIITSGDDNFGFAGWAENNQTALFEMLGEGRHFGEWWGRGIQRTYGLAERRFSLFNTHRWGERGPIDVGGVEVNCVPVLVQCQLNELNQKVASALCGLRLDGSRAANFTDAEGVMVYLSNVGYLKHPFDPEPKGQVAA